MAARPDSQGALQRAAPLTGVAFAVLAVAAIALWGDVIEPGQAAEEKAAPYLEDPQEVLAGAQLLGLAGFFLLWFGGSLRRAIAQLAGEDRLGAIALAGAAATSGLLLAGAAAHGAVALRADEVGSIDAEAAAAVGDLGSLLMAAAAPLAMAVITAATAVASLRMRGLLPTWLAWLSLVLSLGLLAMPINYAVMPLFLAWVVAVSILLYLRDPTATSP